MREACRTMATKIVLKGMLYITTVGILNAQNFVWSPCSRTCGRGTRHRPCGPDETPNCEQKYEDCTIAACPDANCIAPNAFKYKNPNECCRIESRNSCGVVQIKATSRRIINGTVSYNGQWPWQTALWIKNPKKYICGAVLLNTEWVVTAAHCFEDNGLKAKDVFVKVGINKLIGTNPNGQTSDVDVYVKYPTYVDWNDDIALLKLCKPVRYSTHVHPICQPNNERPDEDEICYVAGWGAATHADRVAQRASNKLLHAGLQILSLGACEEAYRGQSSYKGVTNKTLCVGLLKGGQDSCIGDSGGPLVCQRKHSCQWYFAGIVSFGATECGKANNPGVYTDVQSYQSWIGDILSKNPCEWKPCKNGGTCVPSGNDYICSCPFLFGGKKCETKINPCVFRPCSNGGQCQAKGNQNGYVCFCQPNFTGSNCEISSPPTKPDPCTEYCQRKRSSNEFANDCGHYPTQKKRFDCLNCRYALNACPTQPIIFV